MTTRTTAFATAIATITFGACGGVDVDDNGTPCGPNAACATGFTCDARSSRCGKSATIGDAGLLDAPMAYPIRGPQVASTDRTGGFLYVGDNLAKTISEFSVGADGTLTPLATATIELPPFAMKANPATGTHSLYVGATDNSNGAIYQFDIGADGRLVPLQPATPASTAQPTELLIDPAGQHLWSIDHNTVIRQFNIGADGTLTQNGADIARSGFAGVVTPNGRSLYIVGAADTLDRYDVGADGRITLQGSTAGFGEGLSIHPAGTFLYLNVEIGLATFQIASDGSLSKIGDDLSFARDSYKSAVTPDGKFIYAVGIAPGENSVFQFAIGPDGRPTPLDPPLVSAGTSDSSVTVSPDGQFLYVTNLHDQTVSQFRINADGTLAPLSPPYLPG